MMPESVRETLLAALRDYHGNGKRAAIIWVDFEPMERLSPREWEVVKLVGTGISSQEIADILFVSERTVRSHIHTALEKVGVKNRTQLALWFWKRSVVVTADDDPDDEDPAARTL